MNACSVHVDESASASCFSCARHMCIACWRQQVDDRAWCDPCVELLGRPTPVVLYVLATVLTIGVSGLLATKLPLDQPIALGVWGVAAVTVIIAAVKLYRSAEHGRARHRIVARPEELTRDKLATPYRGRLRRLARAAAPPVSGSMAALITTMSFVLVAAVVPTVLKLPRWLEWELVIAGWWLVWAAFFTVLLYRGWRVASDAPQLLRAPRAPKLDGFSGIGDALGGGCSGDLEGCLVAIAVLLALSIALALAWVLVELLVPALFLGAYWFVVRSLSRVANDRHDCQGQLVRSSLWGGIWAALYTAPIAALVALGHLMLRAR